MIGDVVSADVAEIPDQVEETLEPTDDGWTDLPGGLAVAVVEEGNGHSRIWVRSAVQEPAPAGSTDTAFLPVPVNATEIAVLVPNPEFLGIPGAEGTGPEGLELTAQGQPETARVHWGFQGSEVDTVHIDWAATLDLVSHT